jgi:signal transduction histidine kinase
MTSKAPVSTVCEPAESSHPLEIFAFFRRFRRTRARDLFYTFIWNCFLGAAFWLGAVIFGPGGLDFDTFFWNLVVANAIGYTIHGLFVLGTALHIDTRARAAGSFAIAAYYSLLSMAGVFIGFSLVAAFLQEGTFIKWFSNPRWLAVMAFSGLVVSVILSVIFFWRARHAGAEAALERERSHSERIERGAALANLRALQAQIEPHFLFNTLANVTSLIDPDPAKAKRMLESFIRFLRATLAATRNESTTLAEEAQLIAAYLDVLQIRMGARLRYNVDVPAELHTIAIAPMLLQPVVENSIRHGLEPKLEGGEVAFRARRDGAHVLIEISDTGVGFAPVTRGGVGLTNLRDRLRALYGERASLSVGENGGGGALVTLRLPA